MQRASGVWVCFGPLFWSQKIKNTKSLGAVHNSQYFSGRIHLVHHFLESYRLMETVDYCLKVEEPTIPGAMTKKNYFAGNWDLVQRAPGRPGLARTIVFVPGNWKYKNSHVMRSRNPLVPKLRQKSIFYRQLGPSATSTQKSLVSLEFR